MKKIFVILCIATALIFSSFCGEKKTETDEPKKIEKQEKKVEKTEKKAKVKPEGQPDRITVQHLLIAFKDTIPSKAETVTRTEEEAKKLAYDLLKQIKDGADFDEMVKKYTDDSHPGIYSMSNFGVTPDKEANEFPRAGMVTAFGDVGFPLEINEVGIADFNLKTSKYGWHIIKRLK